ncbi:MAG: hypothetical protein ACFFD4_22665 [Candidatus Odinarchaeota archaeon]
MVILQSAFNDLVQVSGKPSTFLIEFLRDRYSPDNQRDIPHFFDSIDAVESPGIVERKIGDIRDDDGLVPTPDGSMIIRDGFEFRNHFLIFPKFLRYHDSLLDWIAENRSDDWDLRFLVDDNILGISNTVDTTAYSSKAHLFGPRTIQDVNKYFRSSQVSVFYDPVFSADKVEIANKSARTDTGNELHQ